MGMPAEQTAEEDAAIMAAMRAMDKNERAYLTFHTDPSPPFPSSRAPREAPIR